MAREYQSYRPILERLERNFPVKELLNKQDVMDLTGWSRMTVQRRKILVDGYISKEAFARWLCQDYGG